MRTTKKEIRAVFARFQEKFQIEGVRFWLDYSPIYGGWKVIATKADTGAEYDVFGSTRLPAHAFVTMLRAMITMKHIRDKGDI